MVCRAVGDLVQDSLKSERFPRITGRQARKIEENTAAVLRDDFPQMPERLVTLSNWRKAPFSAWGFRNVPADPASNVATARHAAAIAQYF